MSQDTKTMNRIFEISYRHLCENVNTYEKYLYAMVPKTEMDLMFIVDCTGSMGSWIEAVKREIFLIVKGIQSKFRTSCIRLSFVGYRDIGDKPLFSIFEFNQDWRKFHTFVSSVRASGGGDYPEDVYGGFEEALKQKWGSSARYAVFIADAPCHGNQYHSGSGDSYPEGYPKGVPVENFMKDFAEKNIKFYAGRINKENDKMIGIFEKVYKEHSNRSIGQADIVAGGREFSQFILKTSLEILQGDFHESGRTQVNFEAIYDRIIANMLTNTEFSPTNRFFARKFQEIIQAAKDANNQQIDQEFVGLNLSNKISEELPEQQQEQQPPKSKIAGFFSGIKEYFFAGGKQSKASSKSISAIRHCVEVKPEEGSEQLIIWNKQLNYKTTSSQVNIELSDIPSAKGTTNYILDIEEAGQKMAGRIPIAGLTRTLEEAIQNSQGYIIAQKVFKEAGKYSLFYIYEVEIDGEKVFIPAEKRHPKGLEVNKNVRQQPCEYTEEGIEKQFVQHLSYQHTLGTYMIANYTTFVENKTEFATSPLVYSFHLKAIPSQNNQGYLGFFKFFTKHSCGIKCEEKQLFSPEDFSNPNLYNFKVPVVE